MDISHFQQYLTTLVDALKPQLEASLPFVPTLFRLKVARIPNNPFGLTVYINVRRDSNIDRGWYGSETFDVLEWQKMHRDVFAMTARERLLDRTRGLADAVQASSP